MDAPKNSLSLLVTTLLLAALSLAVPGTARAMFACDPSCSYYFAGGGYASGTCQPYGNHCHCFLTEEEDQHQDSCGLPDIEG
jgi:hypothetical protein